MFKKILTVLVRLGVTVFAFWIIFQNVDFSSLKEALRTAEIPLADVLEIRFLKSKKKRSGNLKRSLVVFIDGSQITCRKVTTAGETISLESERLGAITLALSTVRSIRFDVPNIQFDASWKAIAQRKLKNDLIVIPKEKVLDPVRGVIGGIDENNVIFLLDGEEIPVKREKTYGVVYARNNVPGSPAVCTISLDNSDRVSVQRIVWNGESFQARIADGVDVMIAVHAVTVLDFSAGKVRYLSEIEPRDVEYTPFFDDEAERELIKYRRNKNQQGNPLRLGKQQFARGLWIHSKTILRYRIGSDFRRFQAVMGIDYPVASKGRGDVHVVISGDGKILLEADVKGTDPPRNLDLDVSGVRDLEILVDFGGDLSIADHLVLAEARVIK
ncbi:MAG: NPCBM/NEW2 domain-containing protein [Planctomycetes bacterium]|nr:NPCBM/NEW2 domain-containing protein [Planctomycetota bacterium]